MEFFIIIIAVIIIGVVLLGSDKKSGPKASTFADPKTYRHFEAVESLFVNQSERSLFYALQTALPPFCHLLVKPRLEDVIKVRKDLADNKLRWQLRGRVKSRHVDYVIMRRDGRPLCAIELDGKSHRAKSAAPGDALKDGIFRAAGLPLYRVIVGDDFAQSAAQIAANIYHMSGQKPPMTPPLPPGF